MHGDGKIFLPLDEQVKEKLQDEIIAHCDGLPNELVTALCQVVVDFEEEKLEVIHKAVTIKAPVKKHVTHEDLDTLRVDIMKDFEDMYDRVFEKAFNKAFNKSFTDLNRAVGNFNTALEQAKDHD